MYWNVENVPDTGQDIGKAPERDTRELRKIIPTGGWGLTYKYTPCPQRKRPRGWKETEKQPRGQQRRVTEGEWNPGWCGNTTTIIAQGARI